MWIGRYPIDGLLNHFAQNPNAWNSFSIVIDPALIIDSACSELGIYTLLALVERLRRLQYRHPPKSLLGSQKASTTKSQSWKAMARFLG